MLLYFGTVEYAAIYEGANLATILIAFLFSIKQDMIRVLRYNKIYLTVKLTNDILRKFYLFHTVSTSCSRNFSPKSHLRDVEILDPRYFYIISGANLQ